MAKVISISIGKGGSAKTSTAINLAANLSHRGNRVLLIDTDYQANATFASGINSKTLENSIYNVLTPDRRYRCRIREAILHTEYYDIVPADKDVMDLPQEMKSVTVLRDEIKTISSSYDYIIIDCPPALNIIVQNALVASDHVIIPCEPKPFNFTGMVDMRDMINEVLASDNPHLSVLGILLVRYNKRANLTKTIQDAIGGYATQLHTTLYDVSIRDGIAVGESELAQQPLSWYSPSSNPALDYETFTDETLKRLEVN